jgi:ER membrane protein complex subunit 1
VPTWRFVVPAGSRLISTSSRAANEKVASIGRVLGDRSVLYKYLNPNLLVIAVTTPAKSTLTIYLLDNVSGQIVYESKLHGVDTSKSIKTQIVENVVYWTYYSTGDSSGQSRGTRITVAELYESPLKNENYNKYAP